VGGYEFMSQTSALPPIGQVESFMPPDEW
jgi:hypothetical protein